jgi:hypothetical protein
VFVYTEAACGVTLWVDIYQECAFPGEGEICAKIDNGGSLTNTAFLIAYSYYFCHEA